MRNAVGAFYAMGLNGSRMTSELGVTTQTLSYNIPK